MDIYHLFNKIDIKASFCYQTYNIECNNSTEKEFNKAREFFSSEPETQFSDDEYHLMKDAVSLAAHEYTHFIDFSSTIFGLEHLSKLAQAAKTKRIYCDDEFSFYPAKQYSNYLKTIRPSEYYNQIFSNNPPQEQWGAVPTSGVYFNSSGKPSTKPIFFFRFLTPDNKQIARSPISLISILESSAMAQETLTRLNLIHRTEDPKFHTIEYNQENLDYLYNSKLTEYSVCAHLIANHISCKDIIITYRISAVLTRIVLNTSPETFNHIHRNFDKTPYYLISKGYSDEKLIKKRMKDALRYRDHGALFYLIVSSMPRRVPENWLELYKIIGETLALVQFPKNWHFLSLEYAENLQKNITSANINQITEIAKSGHENLQKLIYPCESINFNELNLPPCHISRYGMQFQLFNNQSNKLKNINLDDYYQEGTETEVWIDSFSKSCLDFQ